MNNIDKIHNTLQSKLGYKGTVEDLSKYLEAPDNVSKVVKTLNEKVGYKGTVDDFNSYVGIQVPKVEGIQTVSAPSVTVGAPEVNVMSPLASNVPTTPKVDWAAQEEGSITKPIGGELEREQPVNFEGMTPDPKNNPDYSVTNQSGKFVYTFDKEKSDRRKEKDAFNTILDEQEKRINQMTDSVGANIRRNANNVPTNQFIPAYSGAAIATPQTEDGKAQGELLAAQTILKDAKQASKAPKKGENWAKSFGIGGAETVTDPDAWLFGVLSLNEVGQSLPIFEKVEKGEPLTDTESALMDAMLTRTQAEAMRSSDTSNWYKGGKIAGESLPFMRDMAMTGGLSTITTAGGKGAVSLAQKATAKYLRKKAEKQLLKEGIDITEDILSRRAADLFMRTAKVADYSGRVLAASTVTPAARSPLMPTSYSGVAKNMQPKVVGDEFGTYQIQEGDDFGTAVGKQFVEVQSEGVGEFFAPILKGVKLLGGKAIPKVISDSKFGQVGSKVVDAIMLDNPYLQKAGVSGIAGEVGEEIFGQTEQYLSGLTTKEDLDNFYSGDNFKSMLIGFAPMSALGMAGNAINYGSNEVQYRRAKKELGGITDELDNSSVGELGNKISDVLIQNNAFDQDGNLTEEGRQLNNNLVSYAQRKMAKDIANDGKQENPNSKYYDFLLNDRSKKWLESYLADNDLTAPMYFNLAYKATLHENELTDYERKTLSELDRAFNGYLKAEDAAQQASAEIDTQVNPTNNKIQNVMVGGQPHMVKGGNIVMTENEEGKVILDKENSDQVITVVNAEGIPSQIGIEQLESVVGEVDAEEAKNAAIESAHTTAYNETFYPVGSIVYRKDAQGQFSAIKETGADGFIINSVTEGGEAVPTLIENTNSENFGVISLKAGDKYTLNDGTQLDIISNEDGVISASVNGQPSEQTTADELATLFESTGIDLTQFEPVEEAITETEVQEPQQPVETQQVEETQQVQETEAPEVYPTDKKGEPIFEQMPVEQSIKVVREVLGDDAVNFVEDKLKAANKAVKAVAKKAPKSTSLLGRKSEVEAIALEKQKATESLDYWTNVKRLMSEEAIQATREQTPTNQVVENPNQVGQVIIDRYESAKKVIGNSATITAPNGEVLKGRYVLVSAYAVTPSHNPFDGYNTSEGFPLNADGSNTNQRDYKNDKANQVVTEGIANSFGGQALESVPKVSKDGVVLDGNGRTIASQLAAANGTDKAYLEALNNNAANYGFTAADLKSISNPRIVFELETELPYTTEAFAMFNSEEKKSESATASAVAKSKQLSPSSVAKIAALVDSYSSLESFFSSETATAEMVKTLVDAKVINTLEIAKLIDNGLFSATGRELITNVLLGATLNEQAIRQIGNDSSLKGIIVRAMKQILENAKLKEYSLFEDINNAIGLMYEARKAKMSVSDFLLQTNMFEKGASERFSDFEQMLALAMSDSGVLFKGTIDKYNTVAAPLVGGQVDMFTGRILDPNEVKQQIIEYYGKTKSIINPNAGVDGRNRGSETTGTGRTDSGRISLESAQAKFDAATTTEEKYKAALEITLILDEQNNTKTIVAKDNEEFISMLPTEYSEMIRVKVVAGVFFKGNVIINAEKVDTGEELTLVYEHEYAHNANRNVHSSEELVELWNNSTDKKILPRVYLGFADNIKGDELIAHIIEDIIQKQGYENYKNGNIDLSLYSQQEQLKKTIDYANKQYLRNARGGNSRGNLYEDNNARKGNENLQQTDEGRQTPRFRRKDQGELTEVKRNVQGDVSQGGSRVRQAVTTETLLIDGVERPTRNSNGAYIHSTEEGVRNFYAWFGNSKVLDEQGRPLVVYHTTNNEFTSFDIKKSKEGFFFSPNKERLSAYNKSKTEAFYLSIDNPSHELFKSDINYLKGKGYNGIMDYGHARKVNKDLYEIVAFNPEQIKSATDNTGEFNPETSDIRFKIAKSQEELDDFVKDSKVKETVYHATSANFDEFDISKSANGTIWFSTDKESTLDKQQSGKEATRIIEAKINLKNPAGWDEYEKYSIDELIREGYDGAILDEDAFVFSPEQVLISPTDNADIRFKIEANKIDSEYFAAIERGDMDEAQRIVDQQAVKKGYVSADEYKDAHVAPSSSVDKESFRDLEAIRKAVVEDGDDTNVFALANGISNQPDDYFSVNGARWYGYDDLEGRQSASAIKSAMRNIKYQQENYGEVKEIPMVTVYRTVTKDIKESSVRNGDWVTPSENYAKSHGEHRFGTGQYRIIKQEIPADNLWWDGNDINEWGVDDGKEYAYKNTKNNRKLTDVITRDYDGNIIPPSKRFNNREYDPRFSIKSPIGFYSTVENALDKIQQEKGTKEQFKKMLLNNGAKQAEMDWMGFDELPEKLTKADIQNWIDGNKIEVKEVVKGDVSKDYEISRSEAERLFNNGDEVYGIYDNGGESLIESEEDLMAFNRFTLEQNIPQTESTKYSKYALPGGENYKELLLTMPNNKAYKNELNRIAKKYGVEANYISIRESKATDDELAEIRRLDTKPTNFKSSHFDEANILAHIRFDERTVNGERVLFIEEFQSDWAQKGKKEGFIDNSEYEAIPDGENRWDVGGIKVLYFEKGIDGKNYRTINKRHEQLWFPTLQEAVREASSTAKDRFRDREIGKVPDMPFRKTDQWVNLSIRRMMRYAASENFARIAWANGTQQADRYDLSKQVDKVAYSKTQLGKIEISVRNKNMAGRTGEWKFVGEYTQQELPDIVGKDLAEKILKDSETKNKKEYSGLDLKVGGEGMGVFYDAIVPSAMNKLGKPFGAKVETIEIPETGTQQSIPVTESMKETVMEGIPLFKISGEQKETKLPDTIDVDGTQRHTTNSNGKQIHSTEEGIRNFWRWFNNSRVVDEQGRPLVVYHGTDEDFDTFNKTFIGEFNYFGDGFYFTSNKDRVNEYGKNTIEAYLSIKNPFYFYGQTLKNGINKEVEENSYDGVIVDDEKIVFSPSQIKSATGNDGSFGADNADIRFSIKAPKFESGASLKEMVTTSNMFIAARADKYGAKGRRMVESEIKTVGRAISEQSANLKESANLVTDMVKALLNNGSMNNMTRAELSQILTNVRNASNEKDSTVEIDKISSIIQKNQQRNAKRIVEEFNRASSIARQIQLRNAKRRFNDLMKFKVQDKNAKGISIASTVDDETVSIITTIRKSLKELTLEDVENQINEINNLDKKTTSDETKLVGLGIARDYMNEIKTREAQLSELSEELSKAKDDLVGKEGKNRLIGNQLVNSIEVQISQVKSEMTSAYDDLSARLNKIIAEGKEALKNIKLQDKERVATLSHFVNSDMKGIEPKNNPEKGRTFKQWLKSTLIISPLQSFDFMLRSLAPNQVAGNGYLHDHFSRGILSASQNAYEGTEQAFKMIDEAVAKIFGNKFTFRYISARDFKKMSKYELTYGTEKSSTTITATNGQLAYIYAVNKMTDGAMKLRAMGISEEQVEEMKAALPVRIVKLVDAIQDEILPKLRVKYNNAHLEIFNTSMASIENYFPLHIDKTALTQKVDLEEESNKLSGLIKNSTKSIIKRTVNTKPIDIRNSDFSDILTDHIKDMEQWAAFASIRRDMNTLLSNRNFLNRLIELGGFEYMVQFKRAAAIAVDVYQPLSDSYDTAITGVARTVATSKVMLNLYTAFKQTLSVVAYLTEPSPKFQGKVLVNLVKGHASFKWAKDNLPDFRKRWESSALGDEKLSRQFANIASEGDFVKFMDASQKVAQKYGMYPNKMVDSYICAVGAKALYETNYDKYISMGATEEKARERALVDAVNLYNTTQQSSESMFVSGVQLDRTFFSTAYTVFNNSSLAYNRQVFDAARNLKNAFNNRANLIENRTKFNMRTFNVSEEAAKKAATKEVDTQIMRDVLRLAVFGYGVQLVWRLGASFPYLLFGDDDDKKKKIVKEAATGGALITPIRGLLFGATFESFIDAAMFSDNMNMALDRLTGNIHPVISDVDQLAKAAFSKSLTLGKAGYLLVNLFTKLGFGIDLKAFSNATYGFVELMDSDELTANDVLIDIMSMLSVPQSQLKALALDNPETFFDRYIELKELVDYGLLAPVLELNPDDLDNYIKSGRRYMSRDMKEKVEK